ncbi:MAG: ABC transporter permease [Verrucomicrobia subdivision 3 bacterium]|nr:ABC transporter permease [Limisphaerales bacterium]
MQDLKFAARQLLKHPGFTVLAALTLALGIGATSTVFSLIQGVLLTPPPYREPDRLILITPARIDGQRSTRGWPAAQWQEWQRESKTFEAIAGYGWTFNFLVLLDGSESVEGMAVTPDYFKVAGLRPAVGRAFEVSDTHEGSHRVIILGHDLWQRRFNGDPNVVGQTATISRRSRPLTIVGVMPPNVRFLPAPNVSSEPNYDVDAKVDYWIPARIDPNRLTRPDWELIGRLRAGVTVAQAQAELTALASRQAQGNREFEDVVPKLQLLETEMNREGRRLLLPVAGAVALVFLIACGNAAGLLLARGLQRQHEYGVRAALGARALQLCRPVVMESLLVALLGGVVGAALAMWSVDALKAIAGNAIPRLDAVRLGWPVLLFSLGAAVVAGLFAGLLPAWRSLGRDTANELKAGSRTASIGRGERRLLGSVAAAQVALTLALLVGAGLLIQTVRSLAKICPGYDTEHVLTMSVTAVGTNWLDFHTQAIERVARLPGVKNTAFGWGVPLTGNKWIGTFEIDGRENSGALKDRIALPTRSVTPDYFAALGLTLAEGRSFRPSDNDKAPQVAIINQAMASRYLPGGTPIGRKLRRAGNQTNLIEIIGVLENSRTDALTQTAEPELYVSFWQSGAFSKHLVVRTHGDPRALGLAVEKELRAIDPTVSVENLKTLEEIRAESMASRTFAMNLLGVFALVACVLAAVGIYGVLSLAVGSRRTEIAIRMAVGAQRGDVFRLMLGEGIRLAAFGIGTGIVVAIVLGTGLKTYLFGIRAVDPLTLAGMVLVVMAITLATCWIPAHRAARVDSLMALRNE